MFKCISRNRSFKCFYLLIFQSIEHRFFFLHHNYLLKNVLIFVLRRENACFLLKSLIFFSCSTLAFFSCDSFLSQEYHKRRACAINPSFFFRTIFFLWTIFFLFLGFFFVYINISYWFFSNCKLFDHSIRGIPPFPLIHSATLHSFSDTGCVIKDQDLGRFFVIISISEYMSPSLKRWGIKPSNNPSHTISHE